MVASFAPRPGAVPTAPESGADRPRLRVIEGGLDRPGPTAATYLRRRLVVLALMVTCVVAVAVGAQAALRPLVASPGGGASAAPGVTPPGPVHVVVAGDTLWSVAEGLTPADGDLRATVDALADANGGPELVVGQRLTLPD